MKKVLIILVILITLAGGIFVYRELSAKAVIRSEISERSKEFIKKRAKQDNQWRYAQLDAKKQAPRSQKIEEEGCFSFTLPYPISFNREDEECSFTYGLTSPRGTLVIYKKSAPLASFNEVPGVSMRRLYTDKYKEEEKRLGGKTYLLFTQLEEEPGITAFYYAQDFYFVASILGGVDDTNKKKFLQMLESVKFYNEE